VPIGDSTPVSAVDEDEEELLMKPPKAPKRSIAERLPDRSYLFIEPSRYVFAGAELYERNGQILLQYDTSDEDGEDDGNDDDDGCSESSDFDSTADSSSSLSEGPGFSSPTPSQPAPQLDSSSPVHLMLSPPEVEITTSSSSGSNRNNSSHHPSLNHSPQSSSSSSSTTTLDNQQPLWPQ